MAPLNSIVLDGEIADTACDECRENQHPPRTLVFNLLADNYVPSADGRSRAARQGTFMLPLKVSSRELIADCLRLGRKGAKLRVVGKLAQSVFGGSSMPQTYLDVDHIQFARLAPLVEGEGGVSS